MALSGTFLSRRELREITGTSDKIKQIAWLTRWGWTYAVSDTGFPVVSRAHMEAKLNAPATRTRASAPVPNWSAA